MNIVILYGNLTRDPELRYTPKGTAVNQFSVAVNRRWKGEDGQSKEEVSFINCIAWGKTGETIAQYLKKGDPILVNGRLKQDTWEDKQSGQKRSALKVIVESFNFTRSGNSSQDPERTRTETRQPAAGSAPTTAEGGDTSYEDDSVPF